MVRFFINDSALSGTASVSRETWVSWNNSTKDKWSKAQIRQDFTSFQWKQICMWDRRSQESRQEERHPACEESIHQQESAWHSTDDLLQKEEWCFWSQPDWLVLFWAKSLNSTFLCWVFKSSPSFPFDSCKIMGRCCKTWRETNTNESCETCPSKADEQKTKKTQYSKGMHYFYFQLS